MKWIPRVTWRYQCAYCRQSKCPSHAAEYVVAGCHSSCAYCRHPWDAASFVEFWQSAILHLQWKVIQMKWECSTAEKIFLQKENHFSEKKFFILLLVSSSFRDDSVLLSIPLWCFLYSFGSLRDRRLRSILQKTLQRYFSN